MPFELFNSALLLDLQFESQKIDPKRYIESIFFGGGTPSLMPVATLDNVLQETQKRFTVSSEVEITVECNPGSVQPDTLVHYRSMGVNRLSIGVQSFNDVSLKSIGRIHSAREAITAIETAFNAGFDNINIDLMYGLPIQTLEDLQRDLSTALAIMPSHLSVYQLTLEPDTPFYHQPPELPNESIIETMQDYILDQTQSCDYQHYEISAYSQIGKTCRHNLNYWSFGDYIGVGPGAHGKISSEDGIQRWEKIRHPNRYIRAQSDGTFSQQVKFVPRSDRAFEFMLNALRLASGFPITDFEQRTGLPFTVVEEKIETLVARNLLQWHQQQVSCTRQGFRFLNDILQTFLPMN